MKEQTTFGLHYLITLNNYRSTILRGLEVDIQANLDLSRGFMFVKNNRHQKVDQAKLRVAYIGHTAQPGGGELALVELVRNLDRTQIDPTVILFSDGPLCKLLHGIAEVNVLILSSKIINLRKNNLGLEIIYKISDLRSIFLFVWQLHLLLRRLKVDIVHTNSLKADIIGGIAARLCGIPLIWHVRDRIAPDYLPRPAVSAFKFLARIIPSHIIANSLSTLETLDIRSKSIGKGNSKISTVVHDGVDISKFDYSRVAKHDNPITIGLIGRISPWKGQDIFLRAADQIQHHFSPVRFLIIGSSLFGEEEFESDIRSFCEERSIMDIVEFAGFQEDICKAIAQLDIVVHASTLPEPFGQVIIEAMAAGKPVIATNGGGVPEIVIDGITGILVPMCDVESMADAISRLIADPGLRAEMGSHGRDRVSESFTIQMTAAKVQKIYQEIGKPRKHHAKILKST